MNMQSDYITHPVIIDDGKPVISFLPDTDRARHERHYLRLTSTPTTIVYRDGYGKVAGSIRRWLDAIGIHTISQKVSAGYVMTR